MIHFTELEDVFDETYTEIYDSIFDQSFVFVDEDGDDDFDFDESNENALEIIAEDAPYFDLPGEPDDEAVA